MCVCVCVCVFAEGWPMPADKFRAIKFYPLNAARIRVDAAICVEGGER